MQNKVLKIVTFFLFIAVSISCDSKKPTKKIAKEVEIVTVTPASFDMYKTSEMASLMRTMLAKNKEVKENIIAGKSLGGFSKEYLAIHTADLTDSSDRNASFETFSKLYINNMKGVFKADKKDRKQAFNRAINSCIACHKTTCLGPIPRIKKLLID